MKTVGSERKLLVAQTGSLYFSSPDVDKWFDYYKFIPKGINTIDRTSQIVFPFRFENKFPMPTDFVNFNKTYEEICLETAQYYLKKSRDENVPILVLWSGGIDSTTLMVSLILAGATSDDVVVGLNNLSIMENFKFYHKFIRNKFRIVSSESMFDLLNGQYLLMGGEGNDQLFGSGNLFNKVKSLPGGADLVFQPHTEEIVTFIWCKTGMSLDNAKLWYSLMKDHSKKYNIDTTSVFDFFWWFNFSLKWQCVYYRIVTRVNEHMRPHINEEFLTKYCHQFYMSEDFQKWSIINPDKKVGNTYQSHKKAAKEFIFAFDKNRDYFDNKLKYGSLSKVFEHRIVPDALTSNYEFIDKVDPYEFYIQDNTFSKY